jgi:hypothetical protein
MKSTTEMLDPSLVIPNTESEDPNRWKERRARLLPKIKQSRTEKEDPKREKPKTAIDEPRRP